METFFISLCRKYGSRAKPGKLFIPNVPFVGTHRGASAVKSKNYPISDAPRSVPTGRGNNLTTSICNDPKK